MGPGEGNCVVAKTLAGWSPAPGPVFTVQRPYRPSPLPPSCCTPLRCLCSVSIMLLDNMFCCRVHSCCSPSQIYSHVSFSIHALSTVSRTKLFIKFKYHSNPYVSRRTLYHKVEQVSFTRNVGILQAPGPLVLQKKVVCKQPIACVQSNTNHT